MSTYTIYRLCIWLPIAIPLVAVLVISTLGIRLSDLLLAEVLVYSLIYGGMPYIALAAWGTWWVSGRTEPEIRRLMLRAPLLMTLLYVPLALLVGAAVGNLKVFAVVAAAGAAMILTLGYQYVGLVLALRHGLLEPAIEETHPT